MTAEALMQSILEAPEDDAPRLVYADWLEEHGEAERAEFIRVQIERALLRESDPRQDELEAKEVLLFETNQQKLLGPLAEFSTGHVFVRGLLDRLVIDAQVFLDHAERLFGWVPLRHATIRNVAGCLSDLAASPYLGQLTSVELIGATLDASEGQALANSPHLARLTSLALEIDNLDSEGLAALAWSSALPRLSALRLTRCRIADGHLRVILGSSVMPQLTSLHLPLNNIGDAGVQGLASSSSVANLESLSLSNNPVGTPGVEALAASPYLTKLKMLDLSYTQIGISGETALARSSTLRNLTHLDLTGTDTPIEDMDEQHLDAIDELVSRFGDGLR